MPLNGNIQGCKIFNFLYINLQYKYNSNKSQQYFFLSKKYLEKAVQGVYLSDTEVNYKIRETKTMEYRQGRNHRSKQQKEKPRTQFL